ncbi:MULTISPECIES: GerAB/ArcD/ProY family transporter [Aneurinibacillus]|uniref:Spore germination protein n=1 Tax=Aneurinibacillus thermoaerophilus TaxID=143495 RepID=A0A1G8CKZ8_ANETH|nr:MULTISPECIES: endospore germination permease [Aneurinibacillus]AMA71924.1 hypothetical protein ACH33_03095 [Aneurinibacillus sp. XH2]MED0675525.1 endospore germination permease [Aneurinibacillus thermoaerophilus]MED0737081.1 endospore germination permease [Aneurinibacillus thermoaerophilus]MED0757349.1 endospore germination permease [Aneurinibacillus thermoaerophilus]MED0762114.1 endospore germination permease [Aneurinibacillus thermoaerophilus]
MYEKGRISSSQLFILIVIYMTSSENPIMAGQDGAIASLFAILPSILTFYLLAQLQKRHPGKILFEYAEDILGKWPGKLVSLLYICFAVEVCSILSRSVAEFVVSTLTPELPVGVYIISMVIVAAYAVYQGIEGIGRFVEMAFPFYFILLVFINMLLIGQFRLENVLPFLDHPPGEILYASYLHYVLPLGEIIFFMSILPYTKRSNKRFFSPVIALVLGGLYIAYKIIITVGVLGPGTAQANTYPYITAIRFVKIGEFIERIDILLLGIFIMMILMRFIVIFYTLVHGVAHLTGAKSVNPLVLPLCFLIIGLSQIFINDVNDVTLYHNDIRVVTAPIFMLLLPALLLVVSWLRRRKQGPANHVDSLEEGKASN